MTKKSKVAAFAASATQGNRFYRISGTEYYGKTKEELKPTRTQLNAEEGTPEVGDKNKGIEATPSNKWAHHITKGPDHPHITGVSSAVLAVVAKASAALKALNS